MLEISRFSHCISVIYQDLRVASFARLLVISLFVHAASASIFCLILAERLKILFMAEINQSHQDCICLDCSFNSCGVESSLQWTKDTLTDRPE